MSRDIVEVLLYLYISQWQKLKAHGLGHTAHGKKGIFQLIIKTSSEIKMFGESKRLQSMSFTFRRTPYAVRISRSPDRRFP